MLQIFMNENHNRKFLRAINELRLCEFDNNKKMGLALDFEKREVSCCENVEQQWKTIFLVCVHCMRNWIWKFYGESTWRYFWKQTHTFCTRKRVESRHSSSSEAMVGEEKGKVHRSSCMNVCMCSHICLSLYMMP